MDVNVKNLEPEVVRRLAEQAEAEGVSAQEWMRQALRRTASLLAPSELVARAAERDAVTRERFSEIMGDLGITRSLATDGAVRNDVRHRSR